MSTKPIKTLNLLMLTALVVGNMIGSGVFLLPSALAAFGSISLLGWLVTGAGAVLLALVFARLSQVMPQTGGPYAFCKEAFGPFIGFQAAYSYWVYAWIGNAAISVALMGYLSYFFPVLADDSVLRLWVILSIVWGLTGVSLIGMWHAGIIQLILTFVKVCPLLLIGVVGLFFIDFDNFKTFNASALSNFDAWMACASLTLWAFIGMESASIPAGDVRDPQKNIPRATILGVLIVALVYFLGSFSIMGILPQDELINSYAPYADAGAAIFSGHHKGWISAFIALGAAASCLGALNGWIMVQAQVPMAAAKDGLFPAIFGKTNSRGAPVWGLLISSTLISILLFMSESDNLVQQFEFIILLATCVVLLPYAYSAIGEIILLRKYPEKFIGARFCKTAILALLAFAYVVFAVIGSGAEAVFYAFLLLLAGIPLYVWITVRRGIS